MSTRPDVNAEQFEYWNEVVGETWVKRQREIDVISAPFGVAVMDRLGPRPGERVLDVGCGGGGTTIELARRTAPDGSAIGVDISRPMLDYARGRAAEDRVENVSFKEADAQTADLGESMYDVAFSRFGVMFFADPVEALGNIARAMKPEGRLGFATWQEVGLNPWMFVPVLAAAPHVGMPDVPEPHEPGPFAFADTDRTRSVLAEAGFHDIEIEPLEREVTFKGGAEQAADVLMDVGPVRQLAADAEPERVAAARTAVIEAAQSYQRDGVLIFPAAAWAVYAKR